MLSCEDSVKRGLYLQRQCTRLSRSSLSQFRTACRKAKNVNGMMLFGLPSR